MSQNLPEVKPRNVMPSGLALSVLILLLVNVWNTFRRSQGHWFSQDDFSELEHVRAYFAEHFAYFAGRYPDTAIKASREVVRWPVFLELSRQFGFSYPVFLAQSYVMHALSGVLAALLARRLGLSWLGAVVTGLLFLWSRPAFTSIYWMSILTQPVSRVLILLNLLLFLRLERGRSPLLWIGLVLTESLALFAHEQSVVLFPLQVLLGFWLSPALVRERSVQVFLAFSLLSILALTGFKFWLVRHSTVDQTLGGGGAVAANVPFHVLGILRDSLWLLPLLLAWPWLPGEKTVRQALVRAVIWMAVALSPYILLNDQCDYYRVLTMFGPALFAGACVEHLVNAPSRRPRLAAALVLLAWQATVVFDVDPETDDFPRGYRARRTITGLYSVLGKPYGDTETFLLRPFDSRSLPPRPLFVVDPHFGIEPQNYTPWLDVEQGLAIRAFFGETLWPITHLRPDDAAALPEGGLKVRVSQNGDVELLQ